MTNDSEQRPCQPNPIKTSFNHTQRHSKAELFFRFSGMMNRKRQLSRSVEKQKAENKTLNFNFTTMKTMKNFSARQLSKKQMIEVRGKGIADGYPYMVECSYTDNNGINRKVWGFGNDFISANRDVFRQVGYSYALHCIGA